MNDEQLARANARLTDMEIGRAIDNEEGTPRVNYLADSVAGPPRLRERQSIVSLSSGTPISLRHKGGASNDIDTHMDQDPTSDELRPESPTQLTHSTHPPAVPAPTINPAMSKLTAKQQKVDERAIKAAKKDARATQKAEEKAAKATEKEAKAAQKATEKAAKVAEKEVKAAEKAAKAAEKEVKAAEKAVKAENKAKRKGKHKAKTQDAGTLQPPGTSTTMVVEGNDCGVGSENEEEDLNKPVNGVKPFSGALGKHLMDVDIGIRDKDLMKMPITNGKKAPKSGPVAVVQKRCDVYSSLPLSTKMMLTLDETTLYYHNHILAKISNSNTTSSVKFGGLTTEWSKSFQSTTAPTSCTRSIISSRSKVSSTLTQPSAASLTTAASSVPHPPLSSSTLNSSHHVKATEKPPLVNPLNRAHPKPRPNPSIPTTVPPIKQEPCKNSIDFMIIENSVINISSDRDSEDANEFGHIPMSLTSSPLTFSQRKYMDEIINIGEEESGVEDEERKLVVNSPPQARVQSKVSKTLFTIVHLLIYYYSLS